MGLSDILFGDPNPENQPSAVNDATSIGDLRGLVELRVEVEPEVATVTTVGAALAAGVFDIPVAAGTAIGKTALDILKFFDVKVLAGLGAGASTIESKYEIEPALKTQIDALGNLEQKVQDKDWQGTVDALDGLWEKGVPPNIIDKAAQIVAEELKQAAVELQKTDPTAAARMYVHYGTYMYPDSVNNPTPLDNPYPDAILRQLAGFEGGISGGVSTGGLPGSAGGEARMGGGFDTAGGTGQTTTTTVSTNSDGYARTTTTTNYDSGVSQTTTKQTVSTPAGPKETVKTTTSPVAASPTDPKNGPQPVLLDLDGNGVKITEFGKSSQFVAGKDGLQHRTSWAGAGDGVLFFDPDGRNAITEARQYVFTEWDPTASGDLEAIRSTFDSNGDGKLTAADADFAKFKVMVTNADGSTTVKTLAELGITEINLTANAVMIGMPDGSMITGQTTFTRANGTTGTVANTTLVAEAAGHRVVETVGTDGVNRGVEMRWAA